MVVATIEAVDVEKSWYYTACNICNRRVVRKVNDFDAIENHVQLNPRYNCIACKKDVEHVIHWYGRFIFIDLATFIISYYYMFC